MSTKTAVDETKKKDFHHYLFNSFHFLFKLNIQFVSLLVEQLLIKNLQLKTKSTKC